jgi:hypothetical protein
MLSASASAIAFVLHFGAVGYLQMGLNTQKALILLNFGNPELHNKVLARRHPNMG